MRTRPFLFLIAVLLLIQSQVSAAVSFVWLCEGKVCGMVSCCCVSPQRHGECEGAGAAQAGNPALCAAGCGCAQGIVAAPDSHFLVTTAPGVPTPFVFVLPTVRVAVEPSQWCVLATPWCEMRGPPVAGRAVGFVSLRGPPVSPDASLLLVGGQGSSLA